MNKLTRPAAGAVAIKDAFWTPYLETIRTKTVPYVFAKFEETGYVENFRWMAGRSETTWQGRPFSDGLLMESVRGVSDFLAASPDPALCAIIDPIIDVVVEATEKNDGFPLSYHRGKGIEPWSTNGDIIISHDLYNLGALIEAGVQHYLATKQTKLLRASILAANRICRDIGPAPKRDAVPGHSLPEEAMMRLYRLLRDHRELDGLAAELGCDLDAYLNVVRFWYDNRGKRDNRIYSGKYSESYNQDHLPFSQQREALGHAVRATLCYTGAAALNYETGNPDDLQALDALWENVTRRKMHISGGIGTRHDIEGFDVDYNLPAGAYLETCASVGLIFWAGEMALLRRRSVYYDVLERALYNTILASVAETGMQYFYQNPLVSDGSIHRWDWHRTPCCPPMLLKLLSSLSAYIYTQSQQGLDINLFIGSEFTAEAVAIRQENRCMRIDSHGEVLTVRVRIPEYAENFRLLLDGAAADYTVEDGYAAVTRVWTDAEVLEAAFEEPPHRVCANTAVEAMRGRVCVMRGAYLMCAEGFDNENDVDFTIAAAPELRCEGDEVVGLRADGTEFRLIPYYRWCRRESDNPDARRMAVWFAQEQMADARTLDCAMDGALYANYEKL